MTDIVISGSLLKQVIKNISLFLLLLAILVLPLFFIFMLLFSLIIPVIYIVCAIFIILIFFHDKILLNFFSARRLQAGGYSCEIITNFSFRAMIHKPQLYFSKRYPNNLYIVDSFFFGPSIVIGENVSKELSSNELSSVLAVAINQIARGNNKFKSILFSLIIIFYIPFWLKYFFRETQLRLGIARPLQYLFYPIELLCYLAKKIIGEYNATNSKEIEIASRLFLISPKDILSSCTKIYFLNNKSSEIMSDYLVRHFALVDSYRDNFLYMFYHD